MPPIVQVTRRGGRRTDPATGFTVRSDMSSAELLAFLRGIDPTGASGRVRHPFEQSIYVHSAIMNIATAMASLPFGLYEASGDRVWEHPYLELLDRPNPEQSGDELVEALCIHREIDGIAYLIEPDYKPGTPPARRRIAVASQGEMTPIERSGALVGYQYTPLDGARKQFLPLTHARALRRYHPRKRLEGLPGATVARLAIEGHHAALDLFRNAILNGAEIGPVFSTDKDLTADQHAEIQEVIRARSGTKNAGKALLVSGGVKLDRGSAGMKDIQWLEGMRVSAQIIATAYNVPLIFVNLMDQAQYNSAPQQVLVFWQMNGLTQKRRIEAALNEFVLRGDRTRYYLRLDTSDVQVLRELEADFMAKVFALGAHGLGRNEVNDRFDLGFENPPWGAVPLAPAGQLPIDVLVDEARIAMGMEQAPEGEGEGEEEPAKGESHETVRALQKIAHEAGQRAEQILAASADVVRSARLRALHRRWLSSWAGLRKVCAKRVQKVLRRQITATKKRLKDVGLPYEPAVEDQRSKIEDPALQTRTFNVDAYLFDLVEEDGALKAAMKPMIGDAAELAGKQIADEIGDVFAYNIASPEASAAIETQVNKVVRINATTRGQIRKTLQQGFAKGETLAELDVRLNSLLEETWQSRGYVIAQTEMHEALSAHRQVAMQQAGVDGKAWITSGREVRSSANPDGVVRYSHWRAQEDSADGIPVTEPFTLTGEDGDVERAMYPGQESLSGKNRINCACASVPRTLKGKSLDAAVSRVGLYTYERMLADRLESRSHSGSES